ncbi:permease [Streptomyces sp. WAC 00631]|uniref:permease n=1 Tax=Streptomyces sp. WAC 00631 TaxID=2203201 RepID=UPI000F799502|nr:permease [Streptomyces sp. WAC 00631]MCC5034932.1 permease [Streptomyces sp. WAC 00631]
MRERTADAAVQFAVLLAELAVLMTAVAVLLALGARRIGVARLRERLGGGRLRGALKGILLGFVMPFCSYSAIPVVAGMVKARVQTATIAGFLLASPLLDPVVVAVLLALFGWQATLGYAVVTFAAVLPAALAADAARLERHLLPARVAAGRAAPPAGDRTADGAPVCGTPDPFGDETPWRGGRAEIRRALRYAMDLARSLAVPMMIAVGIATAIVGFVPQDLVARWAGSDNPLAVPVAALLGVPFYVSTEAFLPIASALESSGMALGAVFALVISAAGVNIPELGLLSRLLSPRLLAAYTLAVVGVAVAVGYLVPVVVR